MLLTRYLIPTFSFIALTLAPALAQTPQGQRCFITELRICIFNGGMANFGMDLSHEYSQQELLAEIAVKYVQLGNPQEARRIAEALTIESIKNAALAQIESTPEYNGTSPLPDVSPEQVELLLDTAQAIQTSEPYFERNESLVRIAVEMAEVGLFDEAEQVWQAIEDEPLQALVLIHMADVYMQIGQPDTAEEKLEQAVDIALALRCNVYPCPGEGEGRILQRIQRPNL